MFQLIKRFSYVRVRTEKSKGSFLLIARINPARSLRAEYFHPITTLESFFMRFKHSLRAASWFGDNWKTALNPIQCI